MDTLKKLPDAEFEIMKVVWANEPPITTNMIMEQLGRQKEWRARNPYFSVIKISRAWFSAYREERQRATYFPLVMRDEYLQFETGSFMEKVHENSFVSLVNMLYNGKKLKDKDLDELMKWMKERRE